MMSSWTDETVFLGEKSYQSNIGVQKNHLIILYTRFFQKNQQVRLQK